MREMIFFFAWGMALYLIVVWLNFVDFFPFVELIVRLTKKVPRGYESVKRIKRDPQMLAHKKKWRWRLLLFSLVYVCCFWLIVLFMTPAAAFLISLVVTFVCSGGWAKKENIERKKLEESIKTAWRQKQNIS